jgi:hypothetical protein
MGADSVKQIKVGVLLDEQSTRAFKRLFDDMTRSVERLTEAASRASRALGGIGGGGVTSQQLRPGTGGRVHASTPAGGAGKVGGVVGQVFGTDANGMRQLASSTNQAFQSAGTGIKSFVQGAESSLKRMQRSVDALKTSMASMSFAAGGGRGRGPVGNWDFMSQISPAAAGVGPGGRNNNFSPFWNGGQVYDGSEGGKRPPPPGSKGPKGPGPWGRFAGAAAGAFGLGFLGPAAGPVAGIAAYNYATGAIEDERLARMKYATSEPIERMTRRAAVASPFNQLFGAVQGGRVSEQIAFKSALARPDVNRALMNTQVQRDQIAGLLTGQGSNKLSAFGKSLKGYGGMTLDSISRAISGDSNLSDDDRRTAMQLAHDQALRNIGPEQAAQLSAAVAAERQLQDPRVAMLTDRVYQGAHSRVATLRSMGMSTRDRWATRDGVTRPVAAYEAMESKLMKGGWTMGDYAAGHQQLLGIGSGYGKAVGPLGLVSAGIGGLGNAAELTRMGGILGGGVGAAGSFLRNTVQGSIGRGGIDVATGRDLFSQLGSRAMASGQFGAGNTFANYAGAAAGFVGGGMGAPLDVAEQQRRAGMLASGTEQMAGFMSGSKAPLYQMTSLLGSIGAAGGYGGASEALAKMRPEVMQSIAAGGEIPAWARAQGVTKEMARANLKYQERAPLMEVVDSLQGGQAAELLKSYRATEARTGGGFRTFAAEQTKGLTGRAKARRETELAEILGGMVPGTSPEEGAGTLLSQLVVDGPKLKGRGVGAAAPQGLEKEALADQAARTMKAAETIASSVSTLVKNLDAFNTKDVEDAAVSGVKAAAGGQGSDIATAAGDFERAAAQVAAVLRNLERKNGPVKTR